MNTNNKLFLILGFILIFILSSCSSNLEEYSGDYKVKAVWHNHGHHDKHKEKDYHNWIDIYINDDGDLDGDSGFSGSIDDDGHLEARRGNERIVGDIDGDRIYGNIYRDNEGDVGDFIAYLK